MQSGHKLYALIELYDSPQGPRCLDDTSEKVNA